jgi:hypothetical protein
LTAEEVGVTGVIGAVVVELVAKDVVGVAVVLMVFPIDEEEPPRRLERLLSAMLLSTFNLTSVLVAKPKLASNCKICHKNTAITINVSKYSKVRTTQKSTISFCGNACKTPKLIKKSFVEKKKQKFKSDYSYPFWKVLATHRGRCRNAWCSGAVRHASLNLRHARGGLGLRGHLLL